MNAGNDNVQCSPLSRGRRPKEINCCLVLSCLSPPPPQAPCPCPPPPPPPPRATQTFPTLTLVPPPPPPSSPCRPPPPPPTTTPSPPAPCRSDVLASTLHSRLMTLPKDRWRLKQESRNGFRLVRSKVLRSLRHVPLVRKSVSSHYLPILREDFFLCHRSTMKRKCRPIVRKTFVSKSGAHMGFDEHYKMLPGTVAI